MDLPESTPTQNSPPPPPAVPPEISEAQDIEQNKDIAAFSYLWIMSVVVYFLKRHSPFVRFHAKQAMILFLISIVVLFIPIINKLLELGILALMVLGFINAAQGHKKDVPLIGPLSRGEITIRQAWKEIVDYVARLLKSVRTEKSPPTAQPPAPSASPTPAQNPASPETPVVPPPDPPHS